MKKLYLLCIVSILVISSSAQTISGIINRYVGVDSIGCNYVVVDSVTGYTAGDRVLLIQMKGAVVDTSNTSSSGIILNYNNAGNYEFATIDYISGNAIYFVKKLIRSYSIGGAVQLVYVPEYTDVTIADTLNAVPWNGVTGGVLAFETSGTVTFNSVIDVSGAGFRGGGCSFNDWSACSTLDYACAFAGGKSAQKGEGIAPADSIHAYGRGQIANGGGGGNRVNAGGGGGGNYAKGGRGGYEWSFCSSNLAIGGDGGDSLIYSNAVNRVYLGGGGGGGHQNNNVGTSGTRGGGIVIIKAGVIEGNNLSILANGKDNNLLAGIDAAGGGGAGGTVLLSVANVSSPLTVQCNGGKGGTVNGGDPTCWGPGGGGAGGVVWCNSLMGITTSVKGGLAGIFQNGLGSCNNTSYGALAGEDGATLSGLVLQESNSLCGALPVSSFQAVDAICQFDCISFTNQSVNADAYEWFFPGGQPASDTSANPSFICYTTDGDYDVTLIAKSGADADTLTITNCVHVKPAPLTPVITQVGTTLYCSTDPSYASYQWFDSTAIIPGAVDTFLVITHDGNYNVHVTNVDSCSIAVGINIVLGNELPAIKEFSVSPNPVNDRLLVHLAGAGTVKASVVNMLGQELGAASLGRNGNSITFNVSGLAEGIYFLYIKGDGTDAVKKFIKQ